MTRAGAVVAVALLAACGREPAAAAPDPDAMIACALAGATEFTSECAVERVESAVGLGLVVRHPDGAFRRFEVLTDGRGLATADGVQPAQVAPREGGLEVIVGADRYRFPGTIAGDEGR